MSALILLSDGNLTAEYQILYTYFGRWDILNRKFEAGRKLSVCLYYRKALGWLRNGKLPHDFKFSPQQISV